MSFTLGVIAEAIEAELIGDPEAVITGFATIQNARDGDLAFLSNRRYFPYLATTQATAVILSRGDVDSCPVCALVADDPYLAYVAAVRFMFPPETRQSGIHESACISHGASIADTATVGANTVIGDGVSIGKNVFIDSCSVVGNRVVIGNDTRIGANVTVNEDVKIGARVIIHPGVVIGADGFGIAKGDKGWTKIPQLGSVEIGDDVEIGSNTTIDRGAIDNTVIEMGVKIDNQVQIGHNVLIGEHTAIAGCVAVAGSVCIGKHCMIGGMTAISGHITIADHVTITGMSGVSNSIKEPGVYSAGLNIMENRLWRRNVTRFKHLDDLAKRLLRLEKNLDKK